MPSLNFDYTQFLKKQNALYLLKYQNDPIQTPENPAPIVGYHGHVPCYRSSIHEQRMVRSLVRCLTSPTKPTTATGYKSKANRLPELDRPVTAKPQTSNEENRSAKRAQTAPPDTRSHESDKVVNPTPRSFQYEVRTPLSINQKRQQTIPPSRISMMSAGSSEKIRKEIRNTDNLIRKSSNRPVSCKTLSRPQSNASSLSQRPITRLPISRHPTGYPQTLYGASYWFMWPDDATLNKPFSRPESFHEDRKLNRNDNVIYHKHEGVLPKYMGYVPGYKFRHGSSFGVLTSHAASYGAAFKRDIKIQ